MENTLNNLGLTHQDLNNIASSLGSEITAESDCLLTHVDSKDRQTEPYSQMEDLD